MHGRFNELRCKEVINICDGCRLGYINDLEIDMQDYCVKALLIPGPAKFFGLLGREEDYVVPCSCIRKIGEDIVLVEFEGVRDRRRRDTRKKIFGILGW